MCLNFDRNGISQFGNLYKHVNSKRVHLNSLFYQWIDHTGPHHIYYMYWLRFPSWFSVQILTLNGSIFGCNCVFDDKLCVLSCGNCIFFFLLFILFHSLKLFWYSIFEINYHIWQGVIFTKTCLTKPPVSCACPLRRSPSHCVLYSFVTLKCNKIQAVDIQFHVRTLFMLGTIYS